MRNYWLYTWLDNHQISDIDQLRGVLTSPDVINDLKECAQLVIDDWRISQPEARPNSLIAVAGIDLSGRLDCNHIDCRRAQIDRLFRRAWHYFETIVARDAIAETLVVHKNCPDDEIRQSLVPHFETVLMVRELGADRLVEFLPRVPACQEHWRQHAKEAGIEDIAERETEIVDQLLRDSDSSLEREGNNVVCALNHPDFSHTQWVNFAQKELTGKTEDQIKHDALRQVTRKFFANLTADVSAAKMYSGSLGSTIPMFGKLLANRNRSVANIAFELEFPALDGLSVAQLIEVRLEYQESFTRFQKRLRSFLTVCAKQGLQEATDIRAKLKADLVDGELEELKSSLVQAEKSLKQKSLYTLALGSMIATVGVTTGVMTPPLAFGILSTAALTLTPGVYKFIDDKLKVESDDMYFLLQAENH